MYNPIQRKNMNELSNSEINDQTDVVIIKTEGLLAKANVISAVPWYIPRWTSDLTNRE